MVGRKFFEAVNFLFKAEKMTWHVNFFSLEHCVVWEKTVILRPQLKVSCYHRN